jgi:hypothetical protein
MGFTIDVFEHPASETGKVFSIDSHVLQYYDLEMLTSEIAGFCYGTITNYSGTTHVHEMISTLLITDTSGDSIQINITSNAKTQEEDLRVTGLIAAALWKYAGNRLVNDLMRALYNGTEVQIGSCRINQKGISLSAANPYGGIPDFTIPWETVAARIYNGHLQIYNVIDHNAMCWLDPRTVLHAHTLFGLIAMIMNDPSLTLILKGQRAPFPYFPPND